MDISRYQVSSFVDIILIFMMSATVRIPVACIAQVFEGEFSEAKIGAAAYWGLIMLLCGRWLLFGAGINNNDSYCTDCVFCTHLLILTTCIYMSVS